MVQFIDRKERDGDESDSPRMGLRLAQADQSRHYLVHGWLLEGKLPF